MGRAAHTFTRAAERRLSTHCFLDNADILVAGEKWIAFSILGNIKPWL
ncbi:MAG: hypothetical protein WD276_05220 [Actinomycetota bacterium]